VLLLHVLLLHRSWPLHLMLPSCVHVSFGSAPAFLLPWMSCLLHVFLRTVVARVTVDAMVHVLLHFVDVAAAFAIAVHSTCTIAFMCAAAHCCMCTCCCVCCDHHVYICLTKDTAIPVVAFGVFAVAFIVVAACAITYALLLRGCGDLTMRVCLTVLLMLLMLLVWLLVLLLFSAIADACVMTVADADFKVRCCIVATVGAVAALLLLLFVAGILLLLLQLLFVATVAADAAVCGWSFADVAVKLSVWECLYAHSQM